MNYSVLDLLENSVAKYADKTAVSDNVSELTYSQLYEVSKKIGTALISMIKKNDPVAVFMEKGCDALAAFYGIVSAGGFYSLLNSELPEVRLESIYNTLTPAAVITEPSKYEKAKSLFKDANIVLIEELKKSDINDEALADVRNKMIDTDPLYVNFTSGSTGTPKGIVVGHRSVLDFIGCFTEIFGITEKDVIANQAPFDFDVSVKDIYSAAATGATLAIVPKELFSAPVQLIDYLCERKVTTMIWAVSALCLISTFHGLDYKTPETVNKILFSGEVMPAKHLKEWRKHLPDVNFVNLYGPTEITCNCTYHILDKNDDYKNGIPIGNAFPNEDVFLLSNENEKITAVDTVGEICVRGTALALGYYGQVSGEPVGFVQNPLNKSYRENIYRTGDLGKIAENGEFVFCGRKDFQIKYMGHRIELEEIERAMSAVEGIERCCCIFDQEKERLYGFYVGTIDDKELHATLKEKLPVFMIPGRIRKVDSMPLTKNGKTDRKALFAKAVKKRAKA